MRKTAGTLVGTVQYTHHMKTKFGSASTKSYIALKILTMHVHIEVTVEGRTSS